MRKTLISFLADCRDRGDQTWLACWEGLRLARWSYAQIAATAWQFSRELEARGIAKGDRVLFWGENSPEWVAAFFGCMARGVVAVPLDRQSAPDFVVRVQAQVQARLLLHGEATPPAVAGLPRLPLAALAVAVAHHSTEPAPVDHIDAGDLIEIIYTSGATAEPKGVCLTHRNFLSNLDTLEREIAKYLGWERLFHPIRFLSLLPLSHVFGQFMGIFVPHLLAGEVYFRDSLNPSEVFRAIRHERISALIAFPRLLETLRDKIEREAAASGHEADLTQKLALAGRQHYLRRWWTFRRIHRRFGWKFWAFISGGATLNHETEDFWRRMGYAVIQGYGMTETASVISIPHPFKIVQGSIGKAMPGQEMKLDASGEILVRGANIAAGYWSADGRIRPITGEDGWLRTGDIGERDEAGNLFYRSRQKDMIATAAGMKIYPEDHEEAHDRQPEIRASCVVGIEGARGPEALAVLIPADRDADLDAAVGHANQTLAQHQRILRWIIWPESDFPRTTTQKVIRRLVAETARRQNHKPATDAVASSYLLQQIERISGARVTQAGQAAELDADLKLDSLGRVELLSALEDRYQVDLDETAFSAATTAGEIDAMLREGGAEATAPYPFPDWPHRPPVTWLRRILYYALVWPFLKTMVRLRIEGREHLQGLRGPVIFASNHITMVDPPLILAALPAPLRHRLAVAMAGERLRDWRSPDPALSLFHRLILRIQYTLVVAIFNVFPLPQKSGFRRSFARAGELADRGFHLLIFPEGELTRDGRIQPFQSGTGLLAKQLHAPVVPIRIEGLFALKQRKQYFGGRVRIRFGPPMRFSPETPPADIVREIEAALRAL